MATRRQTGRAQGAAFAATFKALYDDAQTAVEEAVLKGALRVERDAKINAPVDTGRLRASISSRLSNADKTHVYAETGTNVKYASYVEFGTSKQPAQPFLFPAYNQNKEKIKKDIASALKKSLGLG
jgi:HK97 gp10 family phage protein